MENDQANKILIVESDFIYNMSKADTDRWKQYGATSDPTPGAIDLILHLSDITNLNTSIPRSSRGLGLRLVFLREQKRAGSYFRRGRPPAP